MEFSIHQDMDEEENTLRPVDGGSSDQLFIEMYGIGNREIKSIPSKPKKRIPHKKKKNFGRTKTGNNRKYPVAQFNTINASNSTPLIPQRPTID